MQTHTGNALDNPVTLTFNLLISGSMHAKHLQCTIDLQTDSSNNFPFRVQDRPTHRHTDNLVTDTTDHTTHASATAGMNNKCNHKHLVITNFNRKKLTNSYTLQLWTKCSRKTRKTGLLTGRTLRLCDLSKLWEVPSWRTWSVAGQWSSQATGISSNSADGRRIVSSRQCHSIQHGIHTAQWINLTTNTSLTHSTASKQQLFTDLNCTTLEK